MLSLTSLLVHISVNEDYELGDRSSILGTRSNVHRYYKTEAFYGNLTMPSIAYCKKD
jgi:hypothetical protein